MQGKMKAAYMTGIRNVEYREIDIPAAGEGEVLVKVLSTGVCGSDVHYYQHGRIGDFVVTDPMILGHESAGKVVEVGPGVKNLKVGDLVALEPGRTCGKCEFCKTGRYNLCPDVVFFATPPYDGSFCEYIAYPEDMCFKLLPGMKPVEGALIEPLAVGFHAAKRGNATVGQSAVILGSGCIGLCTLLALKARGVNEIYVSDVIDIRLRKAKELGATEIFNAKSEDVGKRIMELTGGRGADLVFETAGSLPATQLAPYIVARGGTIVIVGLTPDPNVEFSIGTLASKEADLVTVFRYCNLYPTCIDAVGRIPLDLAGLVTKSFPFDKIPEALEYNIENKADVVKIVINYE